MNMTKTAVAIIAFTLGLALGSATAPAHAQPMGGAGANEYFTDLEATGYFNIGTDRQMYLTMGLAVCVDLFNDYTVAEEQQRLTAAGSSASAVKALIQVSQKDLCPKTMGVQGRGMLWS